MRILFWVFIGFDRPTTSGHLLCAIIKQLCGAGHTVHILQKDTGGVLPIIPETLSNCPVTSEAIPFNTAKKSDFVSRYLTELNYVQACEKRIMTDFDSVFLQSTTVAGFAAKAVKKRLPKATLCFNVQDIFPYNAAFAGSIRQNGALFRTLAALQRSGYRKADHIITISEDMKDLLVQDGVPAGKIDVVYNWSYQDAPYRDPDLSAVSHLLDPDRFNVVYAGNIGVMQNVELLIETAKRMKGDTGVHFHIIGDGVRKEKLEKSAKENGLENVSFWPMQPPELAPCIYSAASVNVIPLQKNIYRTALPSKTATCLACDRPIILAIGKDSRFAQTLQKEAGCIVTESDDSQALAEAIRAIRDGRAAAQNTAAFFEKNCSITKNSLRYAEIITQRNGG